MSYQFREESDWFGTLYYEERGTGTGGTYIS